MELQAVMGSLPDERQGIGWKAQRLQHEEIKRLEATIERQRQQLSRRWQDVQKACERAERAYRERDEARATIERQRQIGDGLVDALRRKDWATVAGYALQWAALSEGDSGPNLQDPMAAAEKLYEGDRTDDVRAWIDDQEQEHRRTR